jgi:hypothetical protein
MADRTLRRPMFRRGGVANEGIMSGLQDQSVSADPTSGGLNSLVRPGYADGDVVDEEKGGFWNSFLGRSIKAPVDFLAKPVANVINPAINTLVGTEFEQMRTPYDAMDAWTWNKLGGGQHDIYNPDGDPTTDDFVDRTDWGYANLGKGGHKDPDAIEWEEDEPDPNQPKIVSNETGTPVTSRADDITAIYEDLLPMLQGTLGVDQSELGRQKYLELAKFGANLMAQPGGSLTRAIGKAAADPLAGMTRIAEQQRQSKRVPAELAMKIALRETEGGPLMKNARDLMKADNTLSLKDAMAKVMPSDVAGTSKLIIDMSQKGGLGLDNPGSVLTYKTQIEEILTGNSPELAGEFGTPLPEKKKDLGEEEIGNYYVKKNGELVRWDGVKLLKIDDAGFTGKTKKRKKKKK